MRYMNHIELRDSLATQDRKFKKLAADVRKLEAENKRLRKALEPMTKGLFWLSATDVKRARKALGIETPNAKLPGAVGIRAE